MVPKGDSPTMHVRRWVRHHWLPSTTAVATPPCQMPSPSRQHSSSTATTPPGSGRRADPVVEGLGEVGKRPHHRHEKAPAAGQPAPALHASPTRPPMPLPSRSRLDSPTSRADQPHPPVSLASPAPLVTTAFSSPPLPLPMRGEAQGGAAWQGADGGNTSGRSATSASSAEWWSPPRGARTAGDAGGNAAGLGAAERRGRSGASSEDDGEARSDNERHSGHSLVANAASPLPSWCHALSSSPRAPAASDGASAPVAPRHDSDSAASPHGSARRWGRGGPSGGGWALSRSWSSSGISYPRADGGVNGSGGYGGASGAGSGGGSGKACWFGFQRGISADYDIGDLVGRGRTGEVRRATARKGARRGRRGRAEERGQPVVVKTIRKAELTTDEMRAAVRREVAVQRLLPAHPHVVAFEGAYEDHGNVYLVLQECEGGELMDLMMASGVGHASEAAARNVVWQLLHALAHCHAHGVVHRDVKPENVLLVRSGSSSAHDPPQVKLIDFGLAALLPPLPLSAFPAPSATTAAACPSDAVAAAASSSAQHTAEQGHKQKSAQSSSTMPTIPPATVPGIPTPVTSPLPVTTPPQPSLVTAPLAVPLPHLQQALWEVVGSQDYLSPDVIHAAYGTPADVFSLASLAYLLLCGRLPFSPSPRCLASTLHAVATLPAGFGESAWGLGREGEEKEEEKGACVSREGRCAVQSMMAKDAARRPTATMMLAHPWFRQLHSSPSPPQPTTAPGTGPVCAAVPLDPCVPFCLLHVLALGAPAAQQLKSQALSLYGGHAWVRVYAVWQCHHLLGVWLGDSVPPEQGSTSVPLSQVHKALSRCACKPLRDAFHKQGSRLGLKRAKVNEVDVLMAATLVMLPCLP